jgi:hypothetical protein
MLNIDKKIRELQEEISFWATLLTPHLKQLNGLDLEEFSTYLLGGGTEEDEVSAEFAFESLVATYGRLQEVFLAGRNFWPHHEDEFNAQFPYENIISFLREKVRGSKGWPWAAWLIQKRTEGFAEIFSERNAIDIRDCFTVVHRWRRSLAKRAVLEVPQLRLMDLILYSDGRIQSLTNRLSRADQRTFRRALRRYLASEYLFPWLAEHYHPHIRGYQDLFKMAQLEENTMFGFDERDWDELFGDVEIGHNTRGIVIGIMERIAGVLREIGSYDELVGQIVSSNGQWGPGSMIGSQGQVNLIPSDEPGECREILIAFAQGRKSSKTGLGAVMRKVREHLIRCGDSSCRCGRQTRVAIIFTDLWDQSIFAESIGDLQAHHETPPGKIIIGALVNKDKITPQAII